MSKSARELEAMGGPAELPLQITRRHFFSRSATGLGCMALSSLMLGEGASAASLASRDYGPLGPHFPAKAKRIIYLFQAGGPAQQELFDYKPLLNEKNGEQLPESVRGGQRLTGMTSHQSSLPLAGSQFKFARHGQSGAWVSELLPHTANIVDELCIIKSMYTEAINHDPAMTFFQTGSQIAGRPADGVVALVRVGIAQRELALVRRAGAAPTRAASRSTRDCGAAASWIRATRASAFARARTRSSICPIPTASAAAAAARCWTSCKR